MNPVYTVILNPSADCHVVTCGTAYRENMTGAEVTALGQKVISGTGIIEGFTGNAYGNNSEVPASTYHASAVNFYGVIQTA